MLEALRVLREEATRRDEHAQAPRVGLGLGLGLGIALTLTLTLSLGITLTLTLTLTRRYAYGRAAHRLRRRSEAARR